jgi:hypothetical protein
MLTNYFVARSVDVGVPGGTRARSVSPWRRSAAATPSAPARRFAGGADGSGSPLGPPRVFPEHVPAPPPQTAGFSAIGGFGRGALGPLPPGYPAPATRLVLRDLRLLLQLCAPPDEPLAAPGAHSPVLWLTWTGVLEEHRGARGSKLVCLRNTGCIASLNTTPARPLTAARLVRVSGVLRRGRVFCARGCKPGRGYARALRRQAACAARAKGGGVPRVRRPRAGEGAHSGAAPRIELEVGGICVQADAFAAGGPHARRLAVSVHHAELRDCQVPRALRRRGSGRHPISWVPGGQWRGEVACVVSGDGSGPRG